MIHHQVISNDILQFFKDNIHNKYNIYYFGFIFCEFLNLVVTVLCFFATNRFLANRWMGYGFKVWHYYQLPLEEQEMKMAGKYIHTNPMCYTFPRCLINYQFARLCSKEEI